MGASRFAGLLLFTSLAACESSSLYDPIEVSAIEAGKVPPGLARLGEHVALTGDIRCQPQTAPTHCYYRAVPKGSPLALRQAAGGAASEGEGEDAGAGVSAFDEGDEHLFVLVEIKPGAEREEGFVNRPAMEGRFPTLGALGYEDQQAFIKLGVDLRYAKIFLPDSGSSGFFGNASLSIPLLGGLLGAFALLGWYVVRAARGK